MSKKAMLKCFVCATELDNVVDDAVNQPSDGTEFTTYGHYGSTFWDSFDGEEIVINICDDCLRIAATQKDRIARHKRYRQLVVQDTSGRITSNTIVGRQWVDREMVEYYEGPEDHDPIKIEVEEIGILNEQPGLGRVEWVTNWREIKTDLAAQQRTEDGIGGGCKHVHFVAACTDCGARPLEGLR